MTLVIIGRRWFDAKNGNTYFSAVGLIDGEEKANINYEYGYGDHYEDCIYRKLEDAGHLPGVEHYENGGREALWNYCERNNIKRYVTVSDVKRKKDL